MRGVDQPPRFIRDPALPFVEARAVQDARRVCYAPHSHRTFSIGIITGGVSEYRNRRDRHVLSPGATVVVDPEETHACNPLDNRPWSYRMLYLDPTWLGRVQGEGGSFRPHGATATTDGRLHGALARLVDRLERPGESLLARECALVEVFSGLSHALGEEGPPEDRPNVGVDRAAEFITAHLDQALRLEDIRAVSGLSLSHFLRAFKRRHGLSPHAYQLNRRVQKGQELLRRGETISSVAFDLGFADQAHFQRVFKRLVAATPGQYAAA